MYESNPGYNAVVCGSGEDICWNCLHHQLGQPTGRRNTCISNVGTSREIYPQWKPQIASYEEFIKICWSSKQKGQFLAGQGSSFNGSCFASSSSSSPEPVYFSARTVGRWIESHQITSWVFLCWKPMPWICHFPGPAWHEIMGFKPVCVGLRRHSMQCNAGFPFWDLP